MVSLSPHSQLRFVNNNKQQQKPVKLHQSQKRVSTMDTVMFTGRQHIIRSTVKIEDVKFSLMPKIKLTRKSKVTATDTLLKIKGISNDAPLETRLMVIYDSIVDLLNIKTTSLEDSSKIIENAFFDKLNVPLKGDKIYNIVGGKELLDFNASHYERGRIIQMKVAEDLGISNVSYGKNLPEDVVISENLQMQIDKVTDNEGITEEYSHLRTMYNVIAADIV